MLYKGIDIIRDIEFVIVDKVRDAIHGMTVIH